MRATTFFVLCTSVQSCRKAPFTKVIFVAQLNAFFVALKLQPAAISSRFYLVKFVRARLFRSLLKGETAAQSHRVSWVASQTAGINCTKIAMKSQLVYTRDFEVATSTRQKLPV